MISCAFAYCILDNKNKTDSDNKIRFIILNFSGYYILNAFIIDKYCIFFLFIRGTEKRKGKRVKRIEKSKRKKEKERAKKKGEKKPRNKY